PESPGRAAYAFPRTGFVGWAGAGPRPARPTRGAGARGPPSLRSVRPTLRKTEQQIDDPAAADVRGVRVATVIQDVRVLGPGVLDRVGEDRHRAEVAGLVHLPGE